MSATHYLKYGRSSHGAAIPLFNTGGAEIGRGYIYSFCRLRHHWRGLALVNPVLLEDDVRRIFQQRHF